VESARVQRQMEIPTDEYWNMMLDEMVDIDEERLMALEVFLRQKERVAKAYNKKVKSKSFNVGDFVSKVLLPIDERDRVLEKWSPNWQGPFKVLQVFSNSAYEIEELASGNKIFRISGKYLKKYRPILQEVNIVHVIAIFGCQIINRI